MRRVSGALTAPVVSIVLSIVLPVASAMIAGCASTAGLSKDSPAAEKQAAVSKRAEARWQALIHGDFDAAYAYFTPASRETLRPGDFAARMSKFPYRSAKVERVECEDEVCTVDLTLTYDNPSMRMSNVPTMLHEKWVIEGGQAWFVFRG